VTADGLFLGLGQDVGRLQARTRLPHVSGVEYFYAEVVDALRRTGVLEQNQLQRRLIEGEVRVARAALVGQGAEELAVVVDGFVDVAHVEGELDSHGAFSLKFVSAMMSRGSAPPRRLAHD